MCSEDPMAWGTQGQVVWYFVTCLYYVQPETCVDKFEDFTLICFNKCGLLGPQNMVRIGMDFTKNASTTELTNLHVTLHNFLYYQNFTFFSTNVSSDSLLDKLLPYIISRNPSTRNWEHISNLSDWLFQLQGYVFSVIVSSSLHWKFWMFYCYTKVINEL